MTGEELEADDKIRLKVSFSGSNHRHFHFPQVRKLSLELKAGWSDNLDESLRIMDVILECFDSRPYPASTAWPYHLSSASLAWKLGLELEASARLERAERVFLEARDKQHRDYIKIQCLRNKITSTQ